MNHPHPDELLLFASGELGELRFGEVASHVGECATCRGALDQLDESLIALDVARARRRRLVARPVVVAAGFTLAAAAVVAVAFMRQPDSPPVRGWMPAPGWSATAGYVAGGKAFVDIDAQLTRLEQESHYGRP